MLTLQLFVVRVIKHEYITYTKRQAVTIRVNGCIKFIIWNMLDKIDHTFKFFLKFINIDFHNLKTKIVH